VTAVAECSLKDCNSIIMGVDDRLFSVEVDALVGVANHRI